MHYVKDQFIDAKYIGNNSCFQKFRVKPVHCAYNKTMKVRDLISFGPPVTANSRLNSTFPQQPALFYFCSDWSIELEFCTDIMQGKL